MQTKQGQQLGQGCTFPEQSPMAAAGASTRAVSPEVSWKKPEERCTRGVSELMAELWLSKDLSQLKQSSLKNLPFTETTKPTDEDRLNPEH